MGIHLSQDAKRRDTHVAMNIAIKIEISDLPTSEVIHRFRNFRKDIFRLLRDTCLVSIEEIDRATDSFVVRDIPRLDLGLVI